MTFQSNIGILAYGSLINDPGQEITPLVVERIPCVTPFRVEFARLSSSRSNAPTLVPVDIEGVHVNAVILVVGNNNSIDEIESKLWRREIHTTNLSRNYVRPVSPTVNSVLVERLNNYYGIQTVIYTRIGSNINVPITGRMLADKAISSILLSEGKGNDGIRYLRDAKASGIVTALSVEYESEILRLTGANSLDDAIKKLDELREVKRNGAI